VPIPALLARVRIPIPAELAQPIAILGGIILLVFAIWLLSLWIGNARARREASGSRPRLEAQSLVKLGLAAVAALVLADAAFMALTGSLDGRRLLEDLATSIVLVLASALLWRLDVPTAVLAALVYALFAPPLGSLISFGRPFLHAQPLVASFLWAICLLGGVALAVPRLKPTALGVFVGAAAGCFAGRLLALLISGYLRSTSAMWALAYAVILAALLGLATSLVKPSTVR
jgi:hypothetical protein